MKATIADIQNMKSGDRLIFGDCVGKIERDVKFTDNLKCAGMSVRYIIENYPDVEAVRYAWSERC